MCSIKWQQQHSWLPRLYDKYKAHWYDAISIRILKKSWRASCETTGNSV